MVLSCTYRKSCIIYVWNLLPIVDIALACPAAACGLDWHGQPKSYLASTKPATPVCMLPPTVPVSAALPVKLLPS